MNILCFSGSLRRESFNKKFVREAAAILKENSKLNVEYLDLVDYPLPVYNGDIETQEFPQAAKDLAEKVRQASAVVISTPEYNGGMASPLKNLVDWLSRPPLNPWAQKHILLLGASPGALGAVRGLWHSRVPFEALGCFVFPNMMGLPKADQAFDENGALKEKASRERLAKLLNSFIEHVH